MEVLPEEFVVGPARPPRIVLLNPEVIVSVYFDQQRLPHSDGLPGPPRRVRSQVLAFPWLPSRTWLGSHDPHASNHRQARIPFLSRLSLLRHGQTGHHFPHVGFIHRFWTPTPATTARPGSPSCAGYPQPDLQPPPGALAATTTPATGRPGRHDHPRHRAPWPPRPPPPPGALAATTTPPPGALAATTTPATTTPATTTPATTTPATTTPAVATPSTAVWPFLTQSVCILFLGFILSINYSIY
ncbi:gametogenetin-like [Oreochromis aureus]|uniref:gametogenetin-like n=1 Tax=Oreochromis aureus TaxID=47969 RepID=UPI0019538C88|nr:gametogenetin-like [Oreochromis aureus]